MKISWDIDLGGMNTFRMRVRCRCLVEYDNVEELRDALSDPSLPRPFFPIGGGSNLLFTKDFPGTVLHGTIKGIKKLDSGRVYAGAGVVWDDFCAWCADNDLWGPENLSYIPGEVGASAVQNIGAYGREVCELISSVECVDTRDATIISIPAADCCYAYRDSIFKKEWKGRYIVTGVIFKVSETPDPVLDYGHVREAVIERFGAGALEKLTPAMVMETVTAIRKTKLPDVADLGSAGSFFRNPYVSKEVFESIRNIAETEALGPVPHFEVGEGLVKVPAAWLIDQCGLKGEHEGGAAVYDKQPLVIVNASGSASPSDILELERRIIATVHARFGITLHPEVEHI